MAVLGNAPTEGRKFLAALNGPGSNNYMRREMYLIAGAYSFVAPADGWHKIDAVGAGESGTGDLGTPQGFGGAAGGRSIKEIYLFAGDVVNVTVGAGGVPTGSNHGPGGSTTVICAARSLSMTITGGSNAGGVGSGGDVNLTGGARPTIRSTGGASAPSHLATGVSQGALEDSGGAGIGGTSGFSSGVKGGGGGSHGASVGSGGGQGLTAASGQPSPFWDLSQVDGVGGVGAAVGGNGGPGAGGGYNDATDGGRGNGGILGGGGSSAALRSGNGGNGGGGGGSRNGPGGRGGPGAVFIFWDEVTERAAP
jgi:hypothetical protein